MTVLTVGLSHKRSPVALLERIAFAPDQRPELLAELVALPGVDEAIIVSTCNRVEVYVAASDHHAAATSICGALSRHTGVPEADIERERYVHVGDQAVRHLFSVACGLDSMVVGEGQILGQVRDALKNGQQAGTVDRVLNDVGQRALRAGKRAHTETHLDQAGADMVTHGLNVATRYLRPGADPLTLTGLRVLVLGAGSMSALAANTAVRRGAEQLLIANRTFDRAARVAECLEEAYDTVSTRAVPFADVAHEIDKVDLVITCTGAQETVLTRDDVAAAVDGRVDHPLVLLDLALPHDIDSAVHELSGAILVDLEALRAAAREHETDSHDTQIVPAVREIIDEEVAEYLTVRQAERVAPTVKALRSRAADVVAAELARLWGRLPDLEDQDRDEVAHAVRRVADKLLHHPTVRIKQLASDPAGHTYDAAVRQLFDLDPPASGSETAAWAVAGREGDA